MKTGTVGRADLLEAYRAGGPELQSAVARMLGLEIVVPDPELTVIPPEGPPASAASGTRSWHRRLWLLPRSPSGRLPLIGPSLPATTMNTRKSKLPGPTSLPLTGYYQPHSPSVLWQAPLPFSPNCGVSPRSRESAEN